MALDKKTLEELEKKLKEIERLSNQLGANISIIDLKPIERNAGAINSIFSDLTNKANQLGEESDYLVSNFQKLTGEIKNSNAGVNIAAKTFRNLSSIAEQITNYQKGQADLSTSEIIKLQSKTTIEKSRLETAQRVLQSEQIELENQKNSTQFLTLSLAEQNKINNALIKNKAAQESINNLLTGQDISLNELNNQLSKSLITAQNVKNVYGLSGVAVEGINKALGKLGFGGLASQLGIDDAKTKMQELSKEIVANREKEESSLKQLVALKQQLNTLSNQLNDKESKIVDTTSRLTAITSKLNELKNKGSKVNNDELAYYEKAKIELESQLKIEQEEIDTLRSKTKIIEDNVEAEKKELEILQKTNNSYSSINGKFAVLKAGISSMGASLLKNLKDPLVVTGFLIDQIVGAFKTSDKATGDLAKSFNVTYSEASNIREELINIGNSSGDVALNARALQESMIAVGQSLGSNAKLNQADLETFTKLREKAGFTNDELVNMQNLTSVVGGNLENNVANLQFAAKNVGVTNKVLLNEKDIMRDVAKASNAVKLSLAGNPEALGRAAAQAKALGMSLEQIDKIAGGLLDFESSISAELEAQLITGKDINLDQARLYALNNDMEGLAKELAKNFGTAADFSKMNRIQQEAAAKAVGMSREELAKTLIDKEALAKMSAKDPELAKKTLEFARQKGMTDEEISKLKKEDFEKLMKQQSVQDRFNNTVEKLKEIFVSLSQPLLSALDIFMKITKPIAIIAGWIGKVMAGIGGIIGHGPSMITLFATIGLVFLPKILSGIGAMGRGLMGGVSALKSMVTSSIDLVKNLAKGNIAGIFKSTKAPIAPVAPVAPSPAGGGSSNQINQISKFNASNMLKGATALLVFSGALFVAAKAFQQFADVNWEDMAKAGSAIVGLSVVAGIIGSPAIVGFVEAGAFAIGSLGLALIPFAIAARIATPAIEAFGNVISKAFSGIATVIEAASSGISEIFTTLGSIDVSKLLLIGPALLGISAGLAAFGTGSVIGAVGGAISKFFGGGPLESLTELSKLGVPLNLTATALQNVALSLNQMASSLEKIDVSKLEAIKEATSKSLIGSVFGGIKEIITSPIKAIGELISPVNSAPATKSLITTPITETSTIEKTKIAENNKIVSIEKTPTSINLPELKQMIDELKAIRNELQNSNKKPTIIENNMNGTKFGTSVALNTFKTQ